MTFGYIENLNNDIGKKIKVLGKYNEIENIMKIKVPAVAIFCFENYF